MKPRSLVPSLSIYLSLPFLHPLGSLELKPDFLALAASEAANSPLHPDSPEKGMNIKWKTMNK